MLFLTTNTDLIGYLRVYTLYMDALALNILDYEDCFML